MSEELCPCFRCTKERVDAAPRKDGFAGTDSRLHRMFLCETCGNKRCPHAADHRLVCTRSNAPGQPGSLYENAIFTSEMPAEGPLKGVEPSIPPSTNTVLDKLGRSLRAVNPSEDDILARAEAGIVDKAVIKLLSQKDAALRQERENVSTLIDCVEALDRGYRRWRLWTFVAIVGGSVSTALALFGRWVP